VARDKSRPWRGYGLRLKQATRAVKQASGAPFNFTNVNMAKRRTGKRKFSKRRSFRKRFKRTYKKTRKYSRRTGGIGGGALSGFPNSRTVNMRYSSRFHFQNNAFQPNQVISFKYKCHSVQDPEYTTGSQFPHSAMGYSFWRTLYTKYRVVGVKLTAKFIVDPDPATVMVEPMYCGVFLSTSHDLPYDNVSGYVEAKNGTWRMVTGRETRPVTMTAYYSPQKFWGVQSNFDPAYAISTTDTEANWKVYFHCWQALPNPVDTDRTAGDWEVTIDYMVKWSDPVAPPQADYDIDDMKPIGDPEVYQVPAQYIIGTTTDDTNS